MKVRVLGVIAVLVCVFAASSPRAEKAASAAAVRADEIVAKHVEALGGLEKIKALKTLRAKGRLDQGALELPFTLWRKRPDKNRVEIGFKGQFFTLGHDGTRTWWINPLAGVFKPEPVPREYADAVGRWVDFEGPLVDYKKKGHRVEYEGEQKTESGVLHKIKLTLAGGDVWRVYIDGGTSLEVKRTFRQPHEGRLVETTTRFLEYAVVEGVRVYRVIEGKGLDGSPYRMTLQSFEANAPIEDARFETR